MPALDLTGRSVLVLHAHPDDEAIFTGGTMRRLADAGARVILITATNGELGEPLVTLSPDESLAERRLAELERAAELLGVARLVLLGRRDSGLPGWADNAHPAALVTASTERLARRVARIAEVEAAETIVHYDRHGIYSHPDHVAVHRVGRTAAKYAGLSTYESTVDREHLNIAAPRRHLVHAAAQATASAYGAVSAEISLAVEATGAALSAKYAALRAHASQVPAPALRPTGFAQTYRLEWYLRTGPRGILDELGNAHLFAPA